MTELFEKSMNTLELPRVLDMLAGEAVTDEGKELCRSARPSADDNDIPVGGNADPSMINPGIHRKVPFVSVCSDYSGMKSGRFQAAALLPPLRVPRKKTEPGRLTP